MLAPLPSSYTEDTRMLVLQTVKPCLKKPKQNKTTEEAEIRGF
jgi:hypothetical protein